MLALTLQRLERASTLGNLDVRIFADTDSNLEEIEWVRDEYFPDAFIFHAKSHILAPSGCWNILNSIKQGYEAGAENVFLIEEDVMVYPGFFEWHLAQTDCLASCGRKDPRFYPKHPNVYTNPGACLRRPLLQQLIPHVNLDYFTRLREYLDEHFGLWDEITHLDDGLIRRVVRQMGGRAVYPDTPVCAHQGFRAYNNLDIYMNKEGRIQERIAGLRKIISSIRPGDRYVPDFESFIC